MPVGADARGVVDVDLVADGPHALVTGRPPEVADVLRTVVVGLAARYPPDRVEIVAVGGGGRTTFGSAIALPHVVEHVEAFGGDAARRLATTVADEVARRRRCFAAVASRNGDGAWLDGAAPPRNGHGAWVNGRGVPSHDTGEGVDGDRRRWPRLVIVVDATGLASTVGLDAVGSMVAGLCHALDPVDPGGDGHGAGASGTPSDVGVHLVLGLPSDVVQRDVTEGVDARCRLHIDIDGGGHAVRPDRDSGLTGAPTAAIRRGDGSSTRSWLARCGGPYRPGGRPRVEPMAGLVRRSPDGCADELDMFVATIRRLAAHRRDSGERRMREDTTRG